MTESSYTRVPVVRRQLRDFIVAAAVAIAIASAAFVGVRNRELAARQLDLATRSADAAAELRDPLPTVHAALVSEPKLSAKHPYLRRRLIREGARTRVLGADRDVAHADDKLFYDAANRFQRDGAFAELVPDGTGRAIVAKQAQGRRRDRDHRARRARALPVPRHGRRARPRRVGRRGRRARRARAPSASAWPPASPRSRCPRCCGSRGSPRSRSSRSARAVALAQGAGAHRSAHRRAATRHRVALGFLSPAAVAMAILVAAPFLIGIAIGFYDHHHGTWSFVGLHNFTDILSGGGHSLDDPLNFWFILGVTVLWTVANIALHVVDRRRARARALAQVARAARACSACC